MKLIQTTGRGARKAEDTIAVLERRGGASLDGVLPTVRRIVADVRRGGDRVLLRYAKKLDGLRDAEGLRISEEEMTAAWDACSAEMRVALTTAAHAALASNSAGFPAGLPSCTSPANEARPVQVGTQAQPPNIVAATPTNMIPHSRRPRVDM